MIFLPCDNNTCARTRFFVTFCALTLPDPNLAASKLTTTAPRRGAQLFPFVLKYLQGLTLEGIVVRNPILLFSLIFTYACGVDSSDLRKGEGPDDDGGGGGSTTTSSCALDLAHRGFVSTWRVNAGDTVQLPLPSGFSHSFAVDWGDGSGEKDGYPYVSSYDDPDTEHVYDRAGEYKVTIYGLVEAWSFATLAASKDKIIAVNELGDVGWKSLQGAFAGCSNLGIVQGGTTAAVTDMSSMFAATPKLQLDATSWSFKAVTNMQSMFEGVTLPDATYSQLLNRILQTTTQNGVPLDGGDSRYDRGAAAARAQLVAKGWKIEDGGPR